MDMRSFIHANLPDADELAKMLADPSAGGLVARMEAGPSLDSRELRRLVARYADSKNGPFGARRLALYHQVHDLFEALRSKVPLPDLKPYELKDSFLGGEEADLIMLTCSHERRSQESIALYTLLCSKNAVGARRAKIAGGTRIAGMCIQTDFGYRGSFQSSVHPLALPLNLSEVYVLIRALKEYEGARDEADPHGVVARRLANMAYGELSDYARERLERRFDEEGYRFEQVDPIFEEDSTRDCNWLFLEKAGVPVRVELVDGTALEGTIAPRSGDAGDTDAEGRPLLAIRRDDGTIALRRWADVLSIERAQHPAPRTSD